MHTKYNNRKNGIEEIILPVSNIEDIVGDTFGTIVYQEQVMAIAKKIAGFDDNQADSYLRKALAKKKKAMMDLCKRWLIYGKINQNPPTDYDNDNENCTMYDPNGKYGAEIKGALANGYNKKELEDFWQDMEGYASYLFNKSHAACYSYITLLTAYLKRYYPVNFFASVLSIQDNEDKRSNYINIIEKMGISVNLPDVNISNKDFTPIPLENRILYGLGSIKGVGESATPFIIENRPYNNIKDMIEKIPKKYLNKKVGTALILSGACNDFEENRYKLLNEFYTIRKDKVELIDEETWNKNTCMEEETKCFGTTITYKPWWDTIAENETITFLADVVKVYEKVDRNGNMMAFVDVKNEDCIIKCVVFAKTYCNNFELFDISCSPKKILLKGKKDSNSKFIVSSVKKE